nr:hypothetical protein [uncultured Kingella sp.]
MGEAIVGDLCKTSDLGTVQCNSIAERAENIEIFSSFEKRVAKKCAKDGDFANLRWLN